jgi:hypothetical protein
MYICDICNKDISSYDIERRNQHVLICCDRFQKEHVLDIVIGPTQPGSL